MVIFEDEFSDVNIPINRLLDLYERILDASPLWALGDGPPAVAITEDMTIEIKKMAQEAGTTEERIYEAAFFIWSQTPET